MGRGSAMRRKFACPPYDNVHKVVMGMSDD
jgi:hypothetical protein